MNDRGIIYPFTAIFTILIIFVSVSFIELYRTETNTIKEMKQIEIFQSMLGMTILFIEEEGGVEKDTTLQFNEGYVTVKVKEEAKEKILLTIQCFTLEGATYSWELWYDKTYKIWENN
ncbi:hypothetical protein GCM10008967_40340 [Bacillus carboniphilus]|uniref:Competence protein ComG n=1 Tax=Bacillus carboniphilus TaxID=86663 RepID=A0ABP3GHN4_9BACI